VVLWAGGFRRAEGGADDRAADHEPTVDERARDMAEQSKTVDAALTLLRLVADHRGASTASLARALGQSRSAVGRMLTTLEAHGLSRRADHGWTAGLGLLALAAVVEPELRAVARAELDALADRFDETAVLSVRDGDEAVAIEQARGRAGVLQVDYRTGTRHPLSVGASGRALLDPTGAPTVSEGELEPGVRGLAAAVVGGDGTPIASVAVVAPAHRFPPEAEVSSAVRAAARRIGEGLATTGTLEYPDRTARGGRIAVLPTGR
jgi:DNA-binding IclR family transcriptional regulator